MSWSHHVSQDDWVLFSWGQKQNQCSVSVKTRLIAISCMLQAISNRRTDRPTDQQTNWPTDQGTNQPTDQWTDKAAYRVACTQLKMCFLNLLECHRENLKNTGSKKILYPHQIWQLYLGESMIIVNKAVYSAISVACRWAGAVLSLCKPQNSEIRGQKLDDTDRPTNGSTNGHSVL